MFAAICLSYLYLERLESASLEYKEWGLVAVCPEKDKLGRNAVVKEDGLPG